MKFSANPGVHAQSKSKESSFKPQILGGIIAGVVFTLLVIIILIVVWYRRKNNASKME